MNEVKAVLAKIEAPRHASYVKYPLADIPVIIMCGVLSGLDTLGNLAIYAENEENYLRETLGIENIPSKATFGRILSMIDGKQIGEAILEILRQRLERMAK